MYFCNVGFLFVAGISLQILVSLLENDNRVLPAIKVSLYRCLQPLSADTSEGVFLLFTPFTLRGSSELVNDIF